MALLRMDRQDHFLFLTMHHIISDGWSMNILAHEMNTLYGRLVVAGVDHRSEMMWCMVINRK